MTLFAHMEISVRDFGFGLSLVQKRYEEQVERIYPNWKEKIMHFQRLRKVTSLHLMSNMQYSSLSEPYSAVNARF